MFSSHTAGSLGIGHVTEGRAVTFVASAITDLPTHPPTLRFQFCMLLNVRCNFVVLLASYLSKVMICVHFLSLKQRSGCGGRLGMATSGV